MMQNSKDTGIAKVPEAQVDEGTAPATGEPLPLPPTAEALAGTARDLKALRDAVVDAASVGAGLWFSYLFVLFYLLIAVGAVTHRDLILESPVKLPFLNVELPLLGFFWLGPLIFFIVHAYVLLHFVLLAGKVGDFDAELKAQITDDDVRMRLRRQLPSNIFVQFLAGSREVRTGILGALLRLIAQISLVMGPIALLVFFELQFLPYHDRAITWWHRVAVLADIVLVWMLWPSIARGERAGLSWHDLRRGKIVALAFASLAPVLLVTTIATFPGEWLEDTLPSVQFFPWKDRKDEPWRWASLHELLVAGQVDFAARKPISFWSNRLILPGFDAIDHAKFDSEAKIEAASETISLRARHLEGAVLIGANLRKADFTAAQLRGAQMYNSDLRGTKFECADLYKQCAQLQGASLNYAQLQGAEFSGVQLQGAMLEHAQLQGAMLSGVRLQGASLNYAQLQGAMLERAQLQGAMLEHAQLQGAMLNGAQLQGASLNYAELQGAWLDNAQLESSRLDGAQLQGAELNGAQLQGALLMFEFVWRADARYAVWNDARVVHPQTAPKYQCNKPVSCDWSAESFKELKRLLTNVVPEGNRRQVAMLRIEERLDPAKVLEREDEMAKAWEAQAASPPAKERVAKILRETGCTAEGSPYALRGLLRNLTEKAFRGQPYSPFGEQNSQLHEELASAFLDEEHCPGGRGLSDDEKAKLKAIRDRSPLPAAKQ